MTNGNLIKYQTEARRLGIQNINANDIGVLLYQIVEELKSRPSAGTVKLRRHKLDRMAAGVVCGTTLYDYYLSMITDTIRIIRKGGIAYVFKIEHIADIIKREKAAQFRYLPGSDCFEVTLEGAW